jgi:hypothetical protein
MAKVAFSKFDAKVNNKVTNVSYTNSKGETIEYEVKEYLTFEEKMEMINRIVNYSIDDNGFANPLKERLYTTLEMVYAYTNLNFTAKQKEDEFKLYDLLMATGIYQNVLDNIGSNEFVEVTSAVKEFIKNVYTFKNSAIGILSFIAGDYSALDYQASDIQEKLADPDNLSLLKDVVSKLN